ncbi:MAG TPA: GDP-mannose 4,6-dehydratase [Candidatus Binatia bacterium]|nr:GDP-mannose 4,6-dehydratase [Candidatus Binatia bacterium]
MHYLITGGAGFIGSHLAERLLREGHTVTAIDDLCTGAIHNIQSLKARRGFNYVIESIFNRPLLAELIDDHDAVFHLAASVGVRLIVESPVRTIETNVRGTEIVLELANKKKKKVLIASTSEVYGKSVQIPFGEDDDLVMGGTQKGRWSYACSKAIDEFLALAYWKEKKLPVVIVRLFNTVGPRQTGRYGMVLPNFVRAALAGKPLKVFGDGTQSRCFCHVSDTVGALAQLIEHSQAVGQIFNVGSAEEITIGDLAALVKTMTGSASPIQYIPYDEAYEEGFEDMQRRVPDISRIRNLLKFQPSHDIRQIVQSVIDYFDAQVEERAVVTPVAVTEAAL